MLEIRPFAQKGLQKGGSGLIKAALITWQAQTFSSMLQPVKVSDCDLRGPNRSM